MIDLRAASSLRRVSFAAGDSYARNFSEIPSDRNNFQGPYRIIAIAYAASLRKFFMYNALAELIQ